MLLPDLLCTEPVVLSFSVSFNLGYVPAITLTYFLEDLGRVCLGLSLWTSSICWTSIPNVVRVQLW